MPLAISFYTFTQIAYLVDAYRGETRETNYDLPTYSLFVVFFPQLIAGPILRHDELIPQFRQLRNFIFSQKNMALGLSLFSLGLCKNVLIAAHGNSLRSLIMYLDKLSSDEIVKLEIPTGAPIQYIIDDQGKVLIKKNLIE